LLCSPNAKQFKRHNRELSFLRTRLGRVTRDIRRKMDGDEALTEIFAVPLSRAAERWRAIRITDFERRQMAALRQELDREYEAQTDLAKPTSKGTSNRQISSSSRT
jgi:hypothetical protein